ncbi:MAG: hypothetical protein NTZ39_06660 [Methanoregula sp.]|nr:hypothetical protein [Methanoregula sp.]
MGNGIRTLFLRQQTRLAFIMHMDKTQYMTATVGTATSSYPGRR